MLIAVRHGKTAFNHQKSGKERVRGYLPVPLTEEGMNSAQSVAQMLAKLVDKPQGIYSSDTVRAVQSAHEMGKAFKMPIRPSEKLRSFDTGSLDGKPMDDKAEACIRDCIQHPDKKIAGGESYNEFQNRVMPILKHMVESKDTYICICHGRVLGLLKAMSVGKGKPDQKTLLGDVPVDPSGMMIVDRKWNLRYISPKSTSEPAKVS